MQFVDGSLQAMYHPYGQVYKNGTTTEWRWSVSDHLGNRRLLMDDANAILSESHYYAFGLEMMGTWNATATPVDNDYLYNGKELQTELNLGYLDYGARFYDAGIGRFTGVDALADAIPEWSPYHYTFNNPITYNDPTGMMGALATKVVNRDNPEESYDIDDGYDFTFTVSGDEFDKIKSSGSIAGSGTYWRWFGEASSYLLSIAGDKGTSLAMQGVSETATGIDAHVFDGSGSELLSGNYSSAVLGIILSRVKLLPNITNQKLKNIVNELFRDLNGKTPIGNGGAIDAFRNELKTGLSTNGTFHKQKIEEAKNGLENLLRNQRDILSDQDKKITKALIHDITNALNGN